MNKFYRTASICICLLAGFFFGRASVLREEPTSIPPMHVWVGFNPIERKAYTLNNKSHLKIHQLGYSCTVLRELDGKPVTARDWTVRFVEESN